MKISRLFNLLITAIFLTVITGCSGERHSLQGFSLPEGNAKAGKEVFANIGCNACHSLPSVPQKPVEGEDAITIALGGEVRHLKTYGELVTAVVNPSHKLYQGFADKHKTDDGKSAMRNFNDMMTVTELFDLISFLETQYHLQPFERSQYRAYHP